METKSLIIFDYSGTLSIAAPRFAGPDHLTAQLAECGLAGLGIDHPDIFWREIVLPSWEEGSTTAVGYISLMERRIREYRRRSLGVAPDAEVLHDAATLFVTRYLGYSVIDPGWKPLLADLATLPEALTLIATDHYAEATDAIIAHLKDLCLEGTPLRDVIRRGWRRGEMIVANSADLGVHKAERPFWETIQEHLSLHAIRDILLIDDFGAHEQTGDAYGTPDRVTVRRQGTRDMLRDVFRVPVTVLDFRAAAAETSKPNRDAFDVLVKRTVVAIRDYMSDEPFRCQPDQ